MEASRKISCVMLFLILLGLFYGCCRPPAISSVPINLYPQQRDWWCWAASAEMISQYYAHRINQCDSASYVYNVDHNPDIDCCTGCSGDCPCWGSQWGVFLDELKDNWDHFNFQYVYENDVLSWDDLKETIATTSGCGRSPIEALVPGHVVVIYGYAEVAGERYLSYRDPWEPNCEKSGSSCSSKTGGDDVLTTYDAFITRWWGSLYDFEYVEP